MQALRSRAFRWFPSDSLSRKGIPSLEAVKPLYNRKPVWWTRWTYPLVCVNIVVTAYACELTWNHWTELDKISAVSRTNTPTASTSTQKIDGELVEVEEKWVLRPVWQRASFALGQTLLGVALSALLLGAASRQVRRLYIITTPKALQNTPSISNPLSNKSLIVQTVHHLNGRGKVIPVSSCELRKGRGDNEVIIAPEGYTGTFWVGLDKESRIWGKEMSPWHMKQAIYQAFYGGNWSKALNKHGWVHHV
ncbi:hypothetical protein BXZ70DRAFT_1055473 [Cristinia sonorae]|uniref:Uncharacterized protein n=1 Tax=Cristinia sonorae TaxID=1940300 RepID=A0A8K0UUJ1_9AGAR|nr:hypothetical protein BXZ70DRAFT_1055473 [Cristinia sonorae]